jgi:hypothetical protein
MDLHETAEHFSGAHKSEPGISKVAHGASTGKGAVQEGGREISTAGSDSLSKVETLGALS